jgi:16S rRNA (guanine966-N2)-methyltransferase
VGARALRIIAGQWRGRKLGAPAGEATRPTGDRARETLFSMLSSRLGAFDGLSVGDFFAGSGALGLEALSRGAGSCVFVENDRDALAALRGNAQALGVRADIRAQSVLTLGPAPAPLDLLLLDPPYGSGAGAVALERMQRLGWIGPASWISLETGAGEHVAVKGLDAAVERRVGKSRLTLLRLAPVG